MYRSSEWRTLCKYSKKSVSTLERIMKLIIHIHICYCCDNKKLGSCRSVIGLWSWFALGFMANEVVSGCEWNDDDIRACDFWTSCSLWPLVAKEDGITVVKFEWTMDVANRNIHFCFYWYFLALWSFQEWRLETFFWKAKTHNASVAYIENFKQVNSFDARVKYLSLVMQQIGWSNTGMNILVLYVKWFKQPALVLVARTVLGSPSLFWKPEQY